MTGACIPRWSIFVLAITLVGFGRAASLLAQDLEPRAYSNTPVGMNFLLVGYKYSEGALLFDPELPVRDANATVDLGFVGYVRALAIAGKSAKAGVLLPFADLDASGFVDNVPVTRADSGLADPAFYLNVNLYGAPALAFDEFRNFRQETIVGLAFRLTAPLGVYDRDKLLNIGTNRWSLKSEIGVSQAIDRWIFEASLAAIVFTDNDDFDNGKTRRQEPVGALQGHAIYTFSGNIWVSFGLTYFAGGRTTIDGATRNDLQQNWRAGMSLSVPVDRHHSIKMFADSGVSTRTGNDYDALGIAWQYRWGKGF